MQKAFEGGHSSRGKVLSVTPKLLRSLATKIEDMAKTGLPTDSVMINIGGDTILYYEPSLDGQDPPLVASSQCLPEVNQQ